MMSGTNHYSPLIAGSHMKRCPRVRTTVNNPHQDAIYFGNTNFLPGYFNGCQLTVGEIDQDTRLLFVQWFPMVKVIRKIRSHASKICRMAISNLSQKNFFPL
jgi:hypothetical protein